MTNRTSTVMKSACIALAISVTTATVFSISATAAYAERGGNGAGRVNSGTRGNDQTRAGERPYPGNQGRGQLARELAGLNAAHASPTALANASPDSMPGRLNTFKVAQENFVEVVATQNTSYAEYQRILGLSETEIASIFPDGGYEAAVASAEGEYLADRQDAVEAQVIADESLAALTSGRELSPEAMAELRSLLNL